MRSRHVSASLLALLSVTAARPASAWGPVARHEQANYFADIRRPPTLAGQPHAHSEVPLEQVWYFYKTRMDFYDLLWSADAIGDRLTESGRAVFVTNCLNEDHGQPEGAAAFWAGCSVDAHKLDRAKYEAEIASFPADFKKEALKELDELLEKVKQTDAKFADDRKLRAIAIDQPPKVFAEWDAFDAANKPLVDAVRDVDTTYLEGGKVKNCTEIMDEHWKRALRSVKPEKDAPPSDALTDTHAGSLATVGMARCAQWDKNNELKEALFRALYVNPVGRGPRTAAFEAAVVAAKKINGNVRLPYTPVNSDFVARAQGSRARPGSRYQVSSIAKIDVNGDTAHLSFRKEWHDSAQCTKMAATGRWRVNNNHELEQITSCVSFRAVHELENTSPEDIPAELATWLKPGMGVVISQMPHMPIEVYDSAKPRARLIGLFGTQLGK
jgi:hypothetical protein